MILLLSRRRGDQTTELVTDWLERLGADFFRLNAEDLEYPSRFAYHPLARVLELEEAAGGRAIRLPLADVGVVWYRRWTSFESYHARYVNHFFADDFRQYQVAHYLAEEMGAAGQALLSGLRHARWLSDGASSRVDKSHVLSVASEVGLAVPDTLIATTRSALAAFAAAHPGAITKSLTGRPLQIALADSAAASYTSEVNPALLAAGPEVMFPSLLQERVDKAFEVRSFVLGDSVSSMAIFSQSDDQTAVNFRRYNDVRPNRSVPYRLPEDVQAKLLRLMRALRLDTGSADLVRTGDGRHVFLEVNPIGQFGMVSMPCNYHLERQVARYLMDHDADR